MNYVRTERKNDQIRKTRIDINVNKYAEGSAIIETGNTKILITATVENIQPPHLKGTNKGWITAEYSMLPRAASSRILRERNGRIKGRTYEIQRLIGRSLRAVTDLDKLNQYTIIIDCDVLQADGGTRTASITGGFVALYLAVHYLYTSGLIYEWPIKDFAAAISVGKIDEEILLDLNYEEDSIAAVDFNFVMTNNKIIEIQGTAEEDPFSFSEFMQMYKLAKKGIKKLIRLQEKTLKNYMVE